MIKAKTEFHTKKYFYEYSFVRMNRPNIGDQKEIFGKRLERYMNKYHLSARDFEKLCYQFRGSGGALVTERDIKNYLYTGCAPKIDKLVTITRAMGVPITYFCGYGEKEPFTTNQAIASRFRKRRGSK